MCPLCWFIAFSGRYNHKPKSRKILGIRTENQDYVTPGKKAAKSENCKNL